jgi:hypothetical protein
LGGDGGDNIKINFKKEGVDYIPLVKVGSSGGVFTSALINLSPSSNVWNITEQPRTFAIRPGFSSCSSHSNLIQNANNITF